MLEETSINVKIMLIDNTWLNLMIMSFTPNDQEYDDIDVSLQMFALSNKEQEDDGDAKLIEEDVMI